MIEGQKDRGAAWDIIDQAICDYDQFMLDDDYDAQRTLDKIIAKMRERRSFYHTAISNEETK